MRIDHKPQILHILNDLTALSESMLVVNNGEMVSVKQTNKHESVFFDLSAPSVGLPIIGDQGMWGFTTFSSFYDMYKALGDGVSIEEVQNGVLIHIQNGGSKFTYRLALPKRVRGVWQSLDLPKWDIEVSFDKKLLQAFRQSIGLVNADRIRISVTPANEGKLVFTAIPAEGENIWEYKMELEDFGVSLPTGLEFAYTIPLDPITKIPLLDYTLKVSDEEIICFNHVNEDFTLDLYGLTITDNKVASDVV